MKNITFKVVNNKRGWVNKRGAYPVHLRFIHDRRIITYHKINLLVKISESDWSGRENTWVRNSNFNAFELIHLTG